VGVRAFTDAGNGLEQGWPLPCGSLDRPLIIAVYLPSALTRLGPSRMIRTGNLCGS